MVGPVGFILERQQYLGRYQGGFSARVGGWDDVSVRDYGNAAVTIATVDAAGVVTGPAGGRAVPGRARVRAGRSGPLADRERAVRMIGGPSPFARPGG